MNVLKMQVKIDTRRTRAAQSSGLRCYSVRGLGAERRWDAILFDS